MNEILSEEQNEELMKSYEEEYGSPLISPTKDLDAEEVETEIEITESKEHLDFDYLTKKILHTNHLENFDILNSDLALDGESYEPFKKGLWYYHHSIMQPTIVYRINRKTNIDNRKHMLAITAPSGGKTTIKNQIKRITNPEEVIESSGLSHPEQLVGKMKYEGKGKDKKAVENLGILGYKIVLYDEAQDLLNEKNDIYAKSQRIKRIAMDTHGQNTISKKLVDDSKKDILKYDPESRLFDFAHPKKLESAFFDTGSFRRYDIFNLSYETILNINDIAEFKLDDQLIQKQDYKYTLETQYKKSRVDVNFKQGTLDIISYYHKSLLHLLLKHKNQNAFRYALLTRYSLRDLFCKNLLILCLSKNEKNPEVETTINACSDTVLFVLKSIEAINDLGDMGLASDLWGGLGEQDAQCLEFLLRKGATSKEETNVTIKKFWTILGHIYGCRITQARAHFYRLKKEGFVDSKRSTAKEESKLWLKFIPKGIKIESKEENPFEFWKKHLVTVGHKKVLLTVTKKYFTDDKMISKLASVGSVGIWGCVLINNSLYLGPLYNNIIYNNIYEINLEKGYPQTPTVPTVTPNRISTATATHSKPTVKTPKHQPTVTPKPTDRQIQFYDAEECKSIKPNHTKEEVLKFFKENPKADYKKLYAKFGVGCLKFRNELKLEGLI